MVLEPYGCSAERKEGVNHLSLSFVVGRTTHSKDEVRLGYAIADVAGCVLCYATVGLIIRMHEDQLTTSSYGIALA